METDGFRSLVRRAQSGDLDAMDDLLADIRPYLKAVAQGFADRDRASQSTSDLVQEAELRAWKRFEDFQGGDLDEQVRARFRGWMAQIVRRLGIDRVRTRGAKKRAAPGGRTFRIV
jgi:DNA-directed RNA polymerase specialized sigma24 family protein